MEVSCNGFDLSIRIFNQLVMSRICPKNCPLIKFTLKKTNKIYGMTLITQDNK